MARPIRAPTKTARRVVIAALSVAHLNRAGLPGEPVSPTRWPPSRDRTPAAQPTPAVVVPETTRDVARFSGQASDAVSRRGPRGGPAARPRPPRAGPRPAPPPPPPPPPPSQPPRAPPPRPAPHPVLHPGA